MNATVITVLAAILMSLRQPILFYHHDQSPNTISKFEDIKLKMTKVCWFDLNTDNARQALQAADNQLIVDFTEDPSRLSEVALQLSKSAIIFKVLDSEHFINNTDELASFGYPIDKHYLYYLCKRSLVKDWYTLFANGYIRNLRLVPETNSPLGFDLIDLKTDKRIISLMHSAYIIGCRNSCRQDGCEVDGDPKMMQICDKCKRCENCNKSVMLAPINESCGQDSISFYRNLLTCLWQNFKEISFGQYVSMCIAVSFVLVFYTIKLATKFCAADIHGAIALMSAILLALYTLLVGFEDYVTILLRHLVITCPLLYWNRKLANTPTTRWSNQLIVEIISFTLVIILFIIQVVYIATHNLLQTSQEAYASYVWNGDWFMVFNIGATFLLSLLMITPTKDTVYWSRLTTSAVVSAFISCIGRWGGFFGHASRQRYFYASMTIVVALYATLCLESLFEALTLYDSVVALIISSHSLRGSHLFGFHPRFRASIELLLRFGGSRCINWLLRTHNQPHRSTTVEWNQDGNLAIEL